MRKNNKSEFVKDLLLTIIGGVGLFIAAAILNIMFSAPVSQADFDVHKADSTRHLKNIDDKLKTLKDGQNRIIDKLIKGR